MRDSSARARSHHDDVTWEEPLFIDPGAMDPADYIFFREEYPYAINGNSLGRTTIHALGLDRETLNERRRDRLKILRALNEIASLSLPEAASAKKILKDAVKSSAEYAAMARATLA